MSKRTKITGAILGILSIAAIAWAGTISQQPYGISTPYWYGYSSGAPASYYLAMPTLAANDTACGIAATQTLTNKTLTSPTITGGAMSGLTSIAATAIDAGASGTAGSVDVFPSTASKGKIALVAADSAGNTTTTITNASQAAARTYTIPDAGAAAYFVMSTAAQTAAGVLSRADLVENALQPYGIPVNQIMAADGAPLGVSETAGDHFLALGTNTIELQGETSNNETEASVSYIQFVLPPEYVSAGDVKVRIRCQIDGAGTDNASTVDIEAYEQADGAVGSDICATVAQTFAAKTTWYNMDFTITAAGLVAGDVLNIKLTSTIVESASSDLIFYADPPKILLDIKG
jgi:hypothetical protein